MSKPSLVAVAVFVLLTGACTTASGATERAYTPAPRSSALTPNPSAKLNLLHGVSALSAREAWAVGTYRITGTRTLDTLILKWDGTTWSKVKSPNPSATANELSGVSALSSTDAWAIGYYNANGPQDTLILHWDGTSWSQVRSPNPSSTYNSLLAVSALSSTDAWAVGIYTSDTNQAAASLILHWDGTSWSQVTSPNPSTIFNQLFGVSAQSSTDAWAVGQYGMDGYRLLILHWDGVKWSQVTSPKLSTGRKGLSDVSADSSTDALAVGSYRNAKTGAFNTLTLRWNGTVWSKVKSPNPSPTNNGLCCVSVIGPRNGWAVGTYLNAKPAIRTLFLHWNGTVWSKVKSPNPSLRDNELSGVSARSANDAWAVGNFRNHRTGAIDTLILHWNGTSWSRT